MCNCLDEVLTVMEADFLKKEADHITVEHVRYDNSSFSPLLRKQLLLLPITLEIKNQKTGKKRNKKESIIITHCPFCGDELS